MYVYLESEKGLYTVGFFKTVTINGKEHKSWEPESDHTEREKAAERVHYLNGGNNIE
jgi:hypothetical protein